MILCRLAFVLLAVLAVAATPAGAQDRDAITQYSTLEALSVGLYDGAMTVGDMAHYGDLGLGTYNALDGEMIVIDGAFWRATHDGAVEVVEAQTRTPFAALTFFDPDIQFAIEPGLDFAGLGAMLDGHVTNPNAPIAIRIDGVFASLTYRAPSRQTEPYPPLGEALKDQAVWTVEDIEATLVGFWFPDWLGNVNAPAWHLHFVGADGTRGGHVLELETATGEVALDPSSGVTVLLPQTQGFAELDLAKP